MMVGLHSNHNQESAVDSFSEKFGGSICSTLECFDRVIFKGHLPFQNEARLNGFVDHVLKIRRKDFLKLLERYSNDLVAHGKSLAEAAGRPYEYKQGFFRKEALIDDIIRRDRLTEGLVAVLCVQETCKTVRLVHAQGRPVLVHARRPQRVLYFYYLDRDFGLMYVRIQSWFPFTVQVYVNGHSWLARQMARRRMAFIQHDNAFTSINNPTKAQRLADGFSRLPWVRLLDRWAKTVNPLLKTPLLQGYSYYWTTTQAEYSTDVLFASRDKLAELYPRLLDHATVNFGAADILTFLGRKLSPQFLGEVVTDSKKQRLPGARIKHRMKNNWLKMYDKFGRILRVETVINDPYEFRVRRKRERNGKHRMVWCPMNKSVANLHHVERVARAANQRYLEALSVVNDPAPSYCKVERLAERQVVAQRSYAGFNPARRDDVRLFAAVLDGNNLLRGFRNGDIRSRIFPAVQDAILHRRQRHAVGRLLKRLHVRGLVAKVPRTRRWRVTAAGQSVLGACVRLHYHGLATAG
jgi:hypothetical protein